MQVIVQAGNSPGISCGVLLVLSETQESLDKHGSILTLLLAKLLPKSNLAPPIGKVSRTPTIIEPDTRSDFKNTLQSGTEEKPNELTLFLL